MTGVEALGILGGAICLTFPIWGGMILVAWLDRRPTPAERAARTRANVERRREQITRRGW
jgi:uncharacterized iron-regulated membrane protein